MIHWKNGLRFVGIYPICITFARQVTRFVHFASNVELFGWLQREGS